MFKFNNEYEDNQNFVHSGDLGDIIYSLPILKFLKNKNLYINTNVNYMYKHNSFVYKIEKEDGTLAGITNQKYDYIFDLLKSQDYIKDINLIDLNKFNKSYISLDDFRKQKSYFQIADKYLKQFKIKKNIFSEKWLNVKQKKRYKILFSLSKRYDCNNFPWKYFLKKFNKFCAFVGLYEEWKYFCCMYGNIKYCYTSSALDLAETIYGCKLLIGNQSFPYSLAEGLKINTIQATSDRVPDCLFLRENATFFINNHFLKVKKNDY